MTDMTQRAVRDEVLPTLERLNKEAEAAIARIEEELPVTRVNRLAAELSHALNDYDLNCHAVIYPSKVMELAVGIAFDGPHRMANPVVSTGRGSYRRFAETTLADILQSYDNAPSEFRDETREEVIAQWRLAEARVNALRARNGLDPQNELAPADPIVDAIEAYRDGMTAYNSAPGEDEETVDRTYGPPLDVLMDWEQPAQTREGAMAALRLALEEERQFRGLPLSRSMLTAALAYFEQESA